MLDRATEEGEFVFTRRSALQVKTGINRIGGSVIVTTDRLVIPTGARLIEISVTTDCYIMFGTVTVDATSTIGNDGVNSRLLQSGVQILEVPSPGDVLATHMAFIRLSADGVIQVEQLV
jgi:hypothetical protein